MKVKLTPGKLRFDDLPQLLDESTTLELDPDSYPGIRSSQQLIEKIVKENRTVYGVNTGFGAMAKTRIDPKDLQQLQHAIILSSATGTGEHLDNSIVRLILLLKINSLARGFSGVQLQTIQLLIEFFNQKIYPCIPAKGSVGASGDLAPLAHLSLPLLGLGKVRQHGKVMDAKDALKKNNLSARQLSPKEGLALANGTQVSNALAIISFLKAENLFYSGLIAGALSVDAARASDQPFDERIQILSNHPQQIKVAKLLRQLLKGSQIRKSHLACEKVQDPYSLRSQPQVMGACLSQLMFARDVIASEANGVSDNPLVFASENSVLSGGNFHAEYIGMAADNMALAIAEMGAMSERRIALLTDANFSGLPPFLIPNAGLNSGLMVMHVTAAALASENKLLAHPASVDSIPTSANQEDHVSMATFAARRLLQMIENTTVIIAIELIAACQGIDFLRPLKTSTPLEKIHRLIRAHVSFYEKDEYFAPDVEKVKNLIESGKIREKIDFSA